MEVSREFTVVGFSVDKVAIGLEVVSTPSVIKIAVVDGRSVVEEGIFGGLVEIALLSLLVLSELKTLVVESESVTNGDKVVDWSVLEKGDDEALVVS